MKILIENPVNEVVDKLRNKRALLETDLSGLVFIGRSCSSLAFIITKRGDIFAQDPIYICDGLDKFIRIPDKLANLEVSRYAYKEVKNGIAYLIVNTYEEGEKYD